MIVPDSDTTDEDIEIEHLRQQIEDCAEYLKEGETPAECIERNRNDAALITRMLAKERKRVEELEARLQEGRNYG